MAGRRAPASLRARLVGVVVLLVAAALTVSGVLATSLLEDYLLQQVDRQLQEVAGNPVLADQALNGAPANGPGGQPGRVGTRPPLPSDYYLRLYNTGGDVVASSGSSFSSSTPDLPPISSATARSGAPFTVGSSTGSGSWRVAVTAVQGGYLVIARDLTDLDQISTRLALLLFAVGLVALALAAGAAYVLVRRSLRPLSDVEVAAAAIAAGDLSRRVPDEDPRTEVGRMSAALNAMLGRLEGAFDERAAALAASQASERRMRAFVADASHELRTPLTAVSGYAELYRQGAVAPDEVPGTFDRIEGEAERMSALVEDLLLLARLDQQRPLERTTVDLLGQASIDIAAARAAHPGRDITLQVLPGNEAPVVRGDEHRLSQVLRNLLTNALRYSSGPVQVEVGVLATASPVRAVVRVVDHGPGIPDEQKSAVFDRFYRTDAARTRTAGGSGLGLSIVAAIVAAHDGDVRIFDTPGGGATFEVLLPI